MKHPLRTGRLSWLALTALSTGFFLATDSYFFFLLCALLLFLPLFSLLALRLGKKTLCVRLEHAEGHVRLCLDDPAAFPIGTLRITVEKDNRFTSAHELNSTWDALTLDTDPGMIQLAVREARMYDCLWLFSRKMSCDARCTFLQIPAAASPSRFDDLQHPSSAPDRHMEREWRDKHEVREYREGDSLKWIHQKLSYKTGKTMVREFEHDARQTHVIHLDLSGTIDECAQVISCFRTLAERLLHEPSRLRVSWYSSDQLQQAQITEKAGIHDCLSQILSHPRASRAFFRQGQGWLLSAQGVFPPHDEEERI